MTMRLAGRPSWQVTLGDSTAVTIALYVRDVVGLRPLAPPVLPPLDPLVPRAVPLADPPLDIARATQEWEQWWASRDVERTAREWDNWWAARDGNGRGRPGRLNESSRVPPDPRWMDQITAPQPPDFPGFEAWPTLRGLLERHFEDAARWASVQHGLHADRMIAATKRRDSFDIGRLVQRSEREFGRTAPPFVLHITEVPVVGTDGWIVTQRDVVCSRGLLADPAVATTFFTPVVRELVADSGP